MAFPTIPTTGAGQVAALNQLNTTATLTGPNLNTLTKAPGDLLIAIAGEYQSNAGADAAFTGWAGGGLTWTEIRDSTGTAVNRLGVAYARVVTGSETGTVTVTRSGTLVGDASMVVLVISGAHDSAAPEANTMSTGTGTAAPGTLAPSWGADDTLWIAVNGNGMTNAGGTWTANNTAPTNYTDYFGTNPADTSTIGDFALAVAFRQNNTASETAGAFGQDTSNARNSALLIAVRPAAVVSVTYPLAATTAVVSSATGALSLVGSLAATTAAVSDAAGALSLVHSLEATTPVVSSTTGAISSLLKLAAQANVLSSTSGIVSAILGLTAQTDVLSGTYGDITSFTPSYFAAYPGLAYPGATWPSYLVGIPPADTGMVKIEIAGQWFKAPAKVNHLGSWVQVPVKVEVAGTWKETL